MLNKLPVYSLLSVILFVIGYFLVWRPVRAFLMSYMLLPLAISASSDTITVHPGTSTVNLLVVRGDVVTEYDATNVSTSEAVQQEAMVSSRAKRFFYYKSPGDVWLLLGGVGLLILGARLQILRNLFLFHVGASIVAYLCLLVGVTFWIPGLFVMDLIVEYLIPAISMLFVVWVFSINKNFPSITVPQGEA